jgi:hypothetical protein
MIEPMLVLSTAHLTEETCNQYVWRAPFSAYPKGDYGWFVYVAEDSPEDLPVDLEHCFEAARQQNACWIMFDRDAELDDTLQVFKW